MTFLYTVAILAYGLLRSMLGALFGRRRGLAAFMTSYAPDRLPALSPSERANLPAMSSCIACGICGHEVMSVMLAGARSMPDFDASTKLLARLTDKQLAMLEPRCPTRVPMRQIAAFVRTKAADAAKMGNKTGN